MDESNLFETLKKAEAQLLIDFASTDFNEACGDEDGYYVSPEDLSDEIDSERIVSRPCYDEILRITRAQLEKKKKKESRICITGTPGIGKTVFGFVLFRDLVREGYSTVYWDKHQATFFSRDSRHIHFYGLQNKCEINDGSKDVKWRWGAWKHDENNLCALLFDNEVYVVHDPEDGFIAGGNQNRSTKLAVILSYGHDLISHWNRKTTGMPHRFLTMPVFAIDEIKKNKTNLFHGKDMSDAEIDERYYLFGGCIRFFKIDSTDPWEELKTKVTKVVKGGGDISARTKNHRGTIVHVATDFDETNASNTFEKRGFILGSQAIIDQFDAVLQNKGKDGLVTFMNSIKESQGKEAVYGVLFESYAHSMLQERGRVFNIRVVRSDRKNKDLYATIKIPVKSPKVFGGNEASCITEQLENLEVGTYIIPSSSNFPTYDAALVVPGKVVGLTDHPNVALLLQMTVSGATGLRRRPRHSIKQYMRVEMHSALQASVKGFSDKKRSSASLFCFRKPKKNLSVSTFCVPTESFHPFMFQHEENKITDTQAPDQAEFQFVIEIPEFNQLPISKKPVDVIHSADREHHRYMLRDRKRKAVPVQELHQMDDNVDMDDMSNAIEDIQ